MHLLLAGWHFAELSWWKSSKYSVKCFLSCQFRTTKSHVCNRFDLIWLFPPFCQSLCYFLLTLGLELLPLHKLTATAVKEWWIKHLRNSSTNLKTETSSPSLEPLLAPSSEYVIPDYDLDVDVAAERNRILSGSIDNAIIYLSNLRKVFSPFFFSTECISTFMFN